MRLKKAVGNANAKHEIRQGLSFAALSADNAGAVSLRVNAPPAEIRTQPLRWNRIEALTRESVDFFEAFPRILFPLQPLDSLRFCLFDRICHKRISGRQKKNPPPVMSTDGGFHKCRLLDDT